MFRREFISSLGTIPLLPSFQQVKGKFLIVFYISVGNLPTDRAMARVEEMKNKFCQSKPEHFTCLFIPHREWETIIDVYNLENTDSTEVDIWTEEKLEAIKNARIYSTTYSDREEDLRQVYLMFGVPFIEISQETSAKIEKAFDLCDKYGIKNRKQFALDYCRNEII